MKLSIPLLALFMTMSPCWSQRADEKDLVLFGKAWLDPSDYAWSRESFSRIESDSEPGARVKDVGRARVRFINLEEDLLGLDIRVLSYRFEAEMKGEEGIQGVSQLEGERLPRVWIHPVLGFSVENAPGREVQSNIQAGEVFEILDFRGFVPREVPVVGEEWTAKMIRKPDKLYRFREERERRFSCIEKELTEAGEKFRIDYKETVKVTSMDARRSHEIRETEGYYWVLLPEGLVEAVSWESVATEYQSTPRGGGSTSPKIETRSIVNVVRRDPPAPKSRETSHGGEAPPDEPPLPPR